MLTNLKEKGLVLAESSRYSPSFGESRHVETAGHVMLRHVRRESYEWLLLCVPFLHLDSPESQHEHGATHSGQLFPQVKRMPHRHTQNPIYWVLPDSGMLTVDTNHHDITLVRCRVCSCVLLCRVLLPPSSLVVLCVYVHRGRWSIVLFCCILIWLC